MSAAKRRGPSHRPLTSPHRHQPPPSLSHHSARHLICPPQVYLQPPEASTAFARDGRCARRYEPCDPAAPDGLAAANATHHSAPHTLRASPRFRQRWRPACWFAICAGHVAASCANGVHPQHVSTASAGRPPSRREEGPPQSGLHLVGGQPTAIDRQPQTTPRHFHRPRHAVISPAAPYPTPEKAAPSSNIVSPGANWLVMSILPSCSPSRPTIARVSCRVVSFLLWNVVEAFSVTPPHA